MSDFDPTRDWFQIGCDKCGQHWRSVPPVKSPRDVLDAFYSAIPEKFGTCIGGGKHAQVAAGVEFSPDDLMWLRGVAAAIFENHPLTRMVRLDEELGLYDEGAGRNGIAQEDAPSSDMGKGK